VQIDLVGSGIGGEKKRESCMPMTGQYGELGKEKKVGKFQQFIKKGREKITGGGFDVREGGAGGKGREEGGGCECFRTNRTANGRGKKKRGP